MTELDQIAQQIKSCTLCPLHQGRVNAVPGEGPSNAPLMLIGEGPGFHEDQKGRPFVGAAGQFLEELLTLAGFKREEVFIGNVIKCRPPANRDPLPDEIATCTKAYLFRQIEALNPQAIVTLGRFSMALYFPGAKISHIHGQPQQVEGRLIIPMLHPAAGLHQPKNRPLLEEDFRRLPTLLAQPPSSQAEPDPTPIAPAKPAEPSRPATEQLSLF